MKINRIAKIAGLAAFSVLAASATAPVSAAPRNASKATRISRSWVNLKTTLDQTKYSVGQPISVHLTATNTHSSGAYLKFTSGQRFDFSVSRIGQKETVYTWSAARMFTQALGSLWIKPGQSEEFDASVGDEMGQLKPGKYQLVAHLTNSPNSIFAAPVAFEVVDTGITLTTATDKTSYTIGEDVEIGLAATNRKNGVARLPFRSSQLFDVFITDESGAQIWNDGATKRFAQNQHDESWKKGETKKFTSRWNGSSLGVSPKLSAGRYRVQAVLQSTPNVYAAPVFIDITE